MVTFCEKRREKSHLASHKHVGKYTQERIRRRVTCAEPDDVAASVADGVYAVLPTLLHQTSATACLFSRFTRVWLLLKTFCVVFFE